MLNIFTIDHQSLIFHSLFIILKEKKKRKSEECIEYYKKASNGEDCPLIFHSEQYYDKRFESETL